MTRDPTGGVPRIMPDRMARFTEEWGDAPAIFIPEDGAVVEHTHSGPDGELVTLHEHPVFYGPMHAHDENGTAYQPADAPDP